MEKLRSALQQGAHFAVTTLGAERALVVYEGYGVAHGIEAGPAMWLLGEISTSVLASLLEEREPMVLVDASHDERTRDQTSVVLSSLRSVLFVPLPNKAGRMGGFFYADNRQKAGVFTDQHLDTALRFLEQNLCPLLLEARPAESPDLTYDAMTATEWL